MSDEMTLEDGTVVPRSIKRMVHRQSFAGGRNGTHENATVLEMHHDVTPKDAIRQYRSPVMVAMVASASDDRYIHVASEYLAAIVALRMQQGYRLVSMSDLGATLMTDMHLDQKET